MGLPAGPLLLVGGGKMGDALLAGWRAAGMAGGDVLVVEPDAPRRTALMARHGIRAEATPELLEGSRPRTLVVAVKPQVLEAALGPCRAIIGPDTLVLSIAAGKTLATLERLFGPDRPIVRAMPNTPAAVGRGMSVLCANAAAPPARRAEAEALLAAVGETAWVEDEELLHAVTALSGGGPAYVFLLIEALAGAGTRLGLEAALAMRLARATVVGSGELARLSAEPAATLRQNVTSPGGTTQAALSVLMAPDGLQPLIDRALAAATKRSRELG